MSKNNHLHNYQATFSKCKNCVTDKQEYCIEKSKNANTLNNACENMAQENVNRTSSNAESASNFSKLKNLSSHNLDLEQITRVVSLTNFGLK